LNVAAWSFIQAFKKIKRAMTIDSFTRQDHYCTFVLVCQIQVGIEHCRDRKDNLHGSLLSVIGVQDNANRKVDKLFAFGYLLAFAKENRCKSAKETERWRAFQ
jgi:hypothetical protein